MRDLSPGVSPESHGKCKNPADFSAGLLNGVGQVLAIYQLQPDVFPHPSQTKHAPDIRIFTPHVIHSGASDLIPIDSSRSDDEPIVGASGAASIFTATGLLGATAATAAGATTFGVSALAIGAYSPPLSRAAARSADV